MLLRAQPAGHGLVTRAATGGRGALSVKPRRSPSWQSNSGLAPSSSRPGLFPVPAGASVCPALAEWCPGHQAGPCWGALPSLDVHLIGRGAILHLPLGGRACGAEKHRARWSVGKKGPANTPGLSLPSCSSHEASSTFQQRFRPCVPAGPISASQSPLSPFLWLSCQSQ